MLKVILSPEQKAKIAEAVDKLFMFQGKRSDKHEIAMWVDELAEWSYPLDILLTVIKSLNSADQYVFKLNTIKQACQDALQTHQTRFSEVSSLGELSDAEREETTAKIAFLKERWKSDWWKHFLDYDVNDGWKK